ncbi:MAG: serine/threonine-protein kinase, partial [Gemmatimonadetes bacterium]|nr:serine/threonine-protein kinase [Gemmatimonadota bacterium]
MADTFDRLKTALADRYAIQEELGAGGMATVYLAEDLKHHRKVAVKVLRPELAAVLGAERFVKEIETTANLQHPHILPLFDSGEADSFLYYVMPFIDGETLRDKLNRETQLGIDEAVKITTEVADALDYAHRQNVIHRDIKPENILLHDGRPMVADFGIALAVSAAAGGRMTETGMSLGTPHYMSPEQATAEKDLTNRSDIYSLGCVLYEMLTGEPPHTGASAQAIVMKIVTDTPRPVTELRKSVPPNVAAATAKALEKLPADRFDQAVGFAAALGDPTFALTEISAVTRSHSDRRFLWPALSAVLGIGLIWSLLGPESTADPFVTRFQVPVPTGFQMASSEISNVVLSPDGRTLVYATAGMLYRRSLAHEEGVPIPGTELAVIPFFSPDGRWLAFTQGDAIKKIPIDGGPVTTVTDASFFGATWGEDGNIVYTTRGGLWRVSEAGGVAERVTTLGPDEVEHVWPQLLDGGRAVIFTVMGNTGLWDDARVVVLDFDTGERTVVREKATYGRYVPTGHVVFTDAAGTISAIPFDLERRQTTGVPFPVESDVLVATWGGGASFAVSDNGTLAFVRGSSRADLLLLWVDRQGEEQVIGEPLTVFTTQLSPDGQTILADPSQPATLDIWMIDATSGERERVTFAEPGVTSYETPVWAPDGRRIAYISAVGDSTRIHVKEIGGEGRSLVLHTSQFHQHVLDWSPDGEWLLVELDHPESHSDLSVLRVDSVEHRVTVAASSALEWSAQFSPDNRWIAYESNESGRPEVYVVSFPEIEGRRQISTGGGMHPRWAESSRELFYWQDSTLMAVGVSTDGEFQRKAPMPLFHLPDLELYQGRWDVKSDGQ